MIELTEDFVQSLDDAARKVKDPDDWEHVQEMIDHFGEAEWLNDSGYREIALDYVLESCGIEERPSCIKYRLPSPKV